MEALCEKELKGGVGDLLPAKEQFGFGNRNPFWHVFPHKRPVVAYKKYRAATARLSSIARGERGQDSQQDGAFGSILLAILSLFCLSRAGLYCGTLHADCRSQFFLKAPRDLLSNLADLGVGEGAIRCAEEHSEAQRTLTSGDRDSCINIE